MHLAQPFFPKFSMYSTHAEHGPHAPPASRPGPPCTGCCTKAYHSLVRWQPNPALHVIRSSFSAACFLAPHGHWKAPQRRQKHTDDDLVGLALLRAHSCESIVKPACNTSGPPHRMATGEVSQAPQLRNDDDLVGVAAGQHAATFPDPRTAWPLGRRHRRPACAPMMTSLAWQQASTLSARSCRSMMGRCAPRRSRTSSSLCSPTSRKSPAALAACSGTCYLEEVLLL